MTELKIILDRDVLESDLKNLTPDTPVSVLTETFFLLPVVLKVNGKDVFGYNDVQTGEYHPGINLPVFSIILEWMKKIDSLASEREAHFFLADAGKMLITYDSGLINIETNFNEVKTRQDFVEFANSIKLGITSLTERLRQIIPDVFEIDELKKYG